MSRTPSTVFSITFSKLVLRLRNQIFLQRTYELFLLCWRLVSTMAELAAGIDPLEVDLLQRTARSVYEHGLAESHDTLLDTGHGAFEEDEIVLHLPIADEATHTR